MTQKKAPAGKDRGEARNYQRPVTRQSDNTESPDSTQPLWRELGLGSEKEWDLHNEKSALDKQVRELTEENRLLRNKVDKLQTANQQPGKGADPNRAALRLVTGDTIEPARHDWLIPGWLERGVFSLLAGAPGMGKTTLALHVAALVTTGGLWPGLSTATDKGRVLVYAAEDDLSTTIIPNLLAAGADLSQIDFPAIGDNPGAFNPATDLEGLYTHLTMKHRLAIIDPILSIVGDGSGDENKPSVIRNSLSPVQELAKDYKVAVLGITHFLKRHNSSGSGTLDRVLGSQAWGAVARMVWAVDYVDGQRVLMRCKSSAGTIEGGHQYAIEPIQADDYDGTMIRFAGEIDGYADNLFTRSAPDDGDDQKFAAGWLADYLELMTEPQTWAFIASEGKQDGGYSEKQLRTARTKLDGRIVQQQTGQGGNRVVLWGRPDMFD